MKPARKTKDFSIESILADKRTPVQNYQLLSENDEFSATNSNKYFEECIHNRRINHELSETEDCDLNVRRKSEVVIKETYEMNSGEHSNKYSNNSSTENIEYNQNRNKSQTNSVIKYIADLKSNSISDVKETNRKCDKNILKSSEREIFHSNDTKMSKPIHKNVETGEENCDKRNGGDYYKSFILNKEYREEPVKSARRVQDGKLDKERKKQLKQDRSDQFHDNHFKDSSEDEYKRLRNNFDAQENKYSFFKNENKEENEHSRSKMEIVRDIEKLEWLHCTRYKPPKLPRNPKIGKSKRKPSFNPRIPFSTFQLEYLEQKFQTSAYLVRHDVTEMSDVLKIPPNRIKIWFQNRRAKERREFCTNI